MKDSGFGVFLVQRSKCNV